MVIFMRKIIISVLVSILIMVVIPLLAVEFLPPKDNAASTEPQPTLTEAPN